LSDDRAPPALVLLPGLDGTGILFRPFVETLGASIDTQIVTYPAHQPLGYTELEALVRKALPGDRRFVVLGESFSGPIAIRLGADPPQALVGIVLCVTFARNPYPLLGWVAPWVGGVPVKSMPSWARAPFMWGAWTTERARRESALATAAVSEAVLRHRIAAVLTVDEVQALTRIGVPTLVLRASRDHVVPRAATELMIRALPAAELVEIEGPHLLLQSCPSECATVVKRFMHGL